MGRTAKAVATGGLSEATRGSARSFFLGGGGGRVGFEDPAVLAARRAGAGAVTTGLGRLQAEAGAPAGVIQRAQIARERVGLRASAQDRLRAIRKQIAQRGLGRSSIGLGQQRAVSRVLGGQEAALAASLPERIRAERERQTQRLLGGGGAAAGLRPLRQQFRPTTPGLLQTAIGGFAQGLGGKIGGG